VTGDILACLAAERAIRRLIALYCDCVRRHDADSVGSLFTDDARVEIAALPVRVGRQAIIEGLRGTLSAFTYLHQICDTGLIDVDSAIARSRLGVFEVNRPNGSECLNVIMGAYEDEYALSEGGWRFHRRRFNLQSRVLLPSVTAQEWPAIAPGFAFEP
jgi:hypothetical protein